MPLPAGAQPCDIYAAGGTPCVAAHSTVRALYASYGGPLYAVTRASDKSSLDVGVLGAGGLANVLADAHHDAHGDACSDVHARPASWGAAAGALPLVLAPVVAAGTRELTFAIDPSVPGVVAFFLFCRSM